MLDIRIFSCIGCFLVIFWFFSGIVNNGVIGTGVKLVGDILIIIFFWGVGMFIFINLLDILGLDFVFNLIVYLVGMMILVVDFLRCNIDDGI